ncbi:septum formation initiator family protein [Petroclostridium sp. X23]|uniref:FtsB family cell division protein n=1 Tax=Petroclostridium sp. X23 TaxID=3045146 RepID=UPI0024ACB0E7|nr:septum formation initiator family protein [Petroclostridium sp. X23]WHH57616.1 septum formation initiator family protein [Petroclostridium sp. X23]
MKNNGTKSIVKKLLICVCAVYVVYILIQQQITLNAYRAEEKYYLQKISEEQEKTKRLERQKLLYSTDMYIEKIAREKLGFVKHDEKVFIDVTNR